MFGISVFLSEPITNETKEYIKLAKHMGVNGIFSSIHIPENDSKLYKERLKSLANISKDLGLNLMIDISKDALEKAGFSFENLSELKNIGVTGLRMDYGISSEIISKASKEMTIALNASTLTKDFIDELKYYKADFSAFEMWHNYYPREDTGLDNEFFFKTNKFLKSEGFKIVAFVPGDKILRAPIFKGLPTLEEHRQTTTYFSFIDMATNYLVDSVYIGDPEISLETFKKINEWINTKTMSLNCSVIENDNEIKNFVMCSFVPGDKILRAPLFKGLPTLEEHRQTTTYFSFIDMATNYLVDSVYIGDSEISLETFKKINEWINTKTISLNCSVIENDNEIKNFVMCSHKNRPDFSKKVIRSANARFLKIPFIKPKNNIERKIGSITIDNASYGRYMGEVQICKENLPSDTRVNVVANIIEEDIPLLSLIKSNTKYKLNEV